jgi:hypothetical protein
MPSDELYENYVHDIGFLIKELALAAKAKFDLAKGSQDEDFAGGYLTGLYGVVTTMLHSAEGFQIPAEKLTWEGLDPERDLI